MAAGLARLSRPWPFAPALFLQPCSATSPKLLNLCRNLSTTPATKAKPWRTKPSRKPEENKGRKRALQAEATSSFLIPNTLVAPPIWRYPRHPMKFVHMLWLNLKNRAQSMYSTLGIWFMSSPQYFRSWPRFKLNRSAAIPAAKVLHVQMCEALAAGDKDTLRNICTAELFKTLGGKIDSRPKGVRAGWELLRYENTWYYPRIADWRVAYQPINQASGAMRLVKQATISISSVQRLARYDDANGGIKVPGSERARHLTEHIVLQADVDPSTYKSEPWKIWGNLPETTYEEYLSDIENYKAIYASVNAR
ncbi:hypothetical protein F5X99DRAFT_408886 [Biscogniauxia marginata]|nr:hypothetical protein F5X99DRAFT_408886 [Biscogniauxia marginata]